MDEEDSRAMAGPTAPSPPPPIWAVQLSLQAILISIQQFSASYSSWSSFSSNLARGVPSFGINPHDGSAIQPTPEQTESFHLPIEGEAWDEYRNGLLRNAEAIKGLRSFKTAVARESEHLEKLSTSSDSAPTSSNAPFLCLFWQQVIRTSLTRGPVTELNASVPVPATRAAQRPQSARSSGRTRNVKIDIVAQAGRRWVRILTVKRSTLLAEFRETESHLEEQSDDEEGDQGKGATSLPSSASSSASSSSPSAYAPFDQLDDATANSSIINNVRDLLACRAKTDLRNDLTIEINFTRLELPDPDSQGDLHLPFDYLRSAPEHERYQARLQSISNLLSRLPNVEVVKSDAAGVLPSPAGKYLPAAIATGQCDLPGKAEDFDTSALFLPAIPGPRTADSPQHPSMPATRDVNLDVSALVALASDISHMTLPTNDTASADQLQKLFRSGGLKTLDDKDTTERPEQEDGDDQSSSSGKDAKAKYLHGRALAIQLALESQPGKTFMGYLAQASQTCHSGQPLRLHTTQEAADKFKEIMHLVGGPVEQARGNALFAATQEGRAAFWTDSRFSNDEAVKTAFELPVRVVAFDPSSTIESSTQAQQRNGFPRKDFASIMRQCLHAGLIDIANPTQPRHRHQQTSSNPRQTPHTLNSLLMGLDNGMTTLTTNMLSVRWLVREVGRRLGGSVDGKSEWDAKDQAIPHALVLVTNPRSLAERMRIDACGDGEGDAGNTTTKHVHPSPSSKQQLISGSDLLYRGTSYRGESAGQADKANSSKEDPYKTLVHRDTSASSHLRTLLPNLRHRDTQASTGTTASKYLPAQDEITRDTGGTMTTTTLDPNQFSSIESGGSGSSTYPPQTHQWKRLSERQSSPPSRFRRALAWMAGPRPATQLSIRHYKWWPFEGLERGWLRITDAVAWRDGDSHGLPLRSRPAWLKRGMSGQVDLEGLSYDANEAEATREDDRDDGPDPVHRYKRWLVREWRVNRLHWLLLFLTYIGWLLGFSFIVKDIWSDASVTHVNTGASVEPTFFGCTDAYWVQNAKCGLDGQDCAPFSSNTSVAFRCPAGCASTHLGAARAVGAQLPNFVPLVVGGGDAERGMYRADSWVCSAAIHAGIVDEDKGGCGVVWQAGAYSNYIASESHGISSTGFNSSFPSSYFFDRHTTSSKCTDERDRVYIFDVIFSAFTGFVLQPKMIVWFFTLVCVGFWHINYASEPRAFPPTPGGPMGDFLPTLFVGYAIWRLSHRFVFPAFQNLPIERTIWTLGPFWIGVLLNVVFANVPLQRLVASDIQSQPGALTALIIIIVVVIVIAVNQVRVIRKTGYLPKYLTLTIVGAILIGLLAAVPETGLRLHHYIIALVLIPFTAFETRLSLIYCTFLLGMFLNGVGRWGYDGIVQDISTIRGDATMGTDLPSFIGGRNWTGVDPTTNIGWIYWDPLPSASNDSSTTLYDGFDLIVDDVLRLSSSTSNRFNLGEIIDHYQAVDAQSGQLNNITYFPGGLGAVNETIARQPHYLRLAYTSQGSPGDFTAAATAWFNGTWVDYDRDTAT